MSFLNNRFIEALEKIADMFLLSVLWLICCIPIITIGTSTIALYYATVKVVRRETGNLFQEFFRGFRQNIRQGVLLEVIYIIVGELLYVAHRFALLAGLTSMVGKAYYIFSFVILLFLLCVTAYLIPVISRFTLSLFSAFRLALAFSMGNLKTLIPLLFTAIGAVAVIYVFPPALLMIPSAYYYLLSFSVEKVLTGYIKTNMPDAGEHEGMWYMEE